MNSFQNDSNAVMMQLWNAHQDVIDSVLMARKYSFIKEHEREDYRQEIFIRFFNKFHEWPECKAKGIEFGTWLYIEARSSVVSCRRKQVRPSTSDSDNVYFRGRFKFMEDIESLPIADEKYEEDDIVALKKAVSDLEPDDKKVIQMFYNGEDFRGKSKHEGQTAAYYSRRFIKIRNHLRVIKGKYWEGKQVKIKRYPNKARSCAAHANRRKKEVLQISLQGNVVKEWASIADVRANGFNRRSVRKCIKGIECSYGGFIWLFKTDIEKLPELLKRMAANGGGKRRLAKPVEQWSADGVLVKIWPTLLSTKEAGFNPGNIHTAIKKGIACKGYRWQYAEAAENAEQVAA